MTSRRSRAGYLDEAKIKALLKRYRCPVPYHAVRTHFLGAIANPAPRAHPLDDVKRLWGGELPEFQDIDAVNELLQALVMGLWNELTQHQSRRHPFHLTRVALPKDRAALMDYARLRREEIEEFIDGLCGGRPKVALDPGIAEALDRIVEIGALHEGLRKLATDPSKPMDEADVKALHKNLAFLREAAEREMQAIVVTAARLRRRALDEEY